MTAIPRPHGTPKLVLPVSKEAETSKTSLHTNLGFAHFIHSASESEKRLCKSHEPFKWLI